MNKILEWLSLVAWLLIFIGILGLLWNGFAPKMFGLSYINWKESIAMVSFIYLMGVIWHNTQE